MAFGGLKGAIEAVDVAVVEYGVGMAECHRRAPVAVQLLRLRRCPDIVWAGLEARGGVVLRALSGKWRGGVENPWLSREEQKDPRYVSMAALKSKKGIGNGSVENYSM